MIYIRREAFAVDIHDCVVMTAVVYQRASAERRHSTIGAADGIASATMRRDAKATGRSCSTAPADGDFGIAHAK
jgi:hypothetical protein